MHTMFIRNACHVFKFLTFYECQNIFFQVHFLHFVNVKTYSFTHVNCKFKKLSLSEITFISSCVFTLYFSKGKSHIEYNRYIMLFP